MCFMKKQNRADVVITGMGVVASIGQGKKGFLQALLEGRHAFGVMQRPGRQRESSFLGAEIASLSVPERLSKRLLRTASFPDRRPWSPCRRPGTTRVCRPSIPGASAW